MWTCAFVISQLMFYSGIALATPVSSTHLDQYEQVERRAANITGCRCFPGDSCWPTPEEWHMFNQSLGGRLIATIPIASACHVDPFRPYNAGGCADLQGEWQLPETHLISSSSPMTSVFANRSCDPFTPKNAQCVIGSYIQYAVNASESSHIQSTISFVKKNNIRLVIRNTGHDYLGKSTGAGAVGIWTHHMQFLQALDYKSPQYSGKALKIGAGVQVDQANILAHSNGLIVTGGNCPTVGVAGGYTQGGGHGPLTSYLGLAADQVLEWEVVAGSGELMTATPVENQELYWALSGGGGGTYGVVTSMIYKAYPDTKTVLANFTFDQEGFSQDAYYDAIEYYINTLSSIVDSAVSIWTATNVSFTMNPITAPGATVSQVQKLLNPTFQKLNQSGIKYSHFIGEFPTYLDSFNAVDEQYNVSATTGGNRFIPRSLVQLSSANVTQALRTIVATGATFAGYSFDVSKKPTTPSNAVNPQWRDVLFEAVITLPFSNTDYKTNALHQYQITNELLPILQKLTPGGGAYLNEADPYQTDWKEAFYSSNYDALLAAKNKYDPDHLFYGQTAVGSDYWTEQSDGRLCRTS